MNTSRVVLFLPLVLWSLTQVLSGQEPFRSSVQPGDWIPSEFHPLSVTGKFAGKKHCLVCANGVGPVVMIFARNVSEPLVRLMAQLDDVTAKHRERAMGSFAVFLDPGTDMQKQLELIAEKNAFKHFVLSVDSAAGPQDYRVAKDAEITIVLYREFIVKANHAFKKGALTDQAIARILADLPKIGIGPDTDIVPEGAKLEKVASGCKFTEGPAADADGNLFFTDSPRNKIMVLRPGDKLETWKDDSQAANGMRFDARGRLVACCAESGARAVVRFEKDGSRTILADRYQGKRLTAPNDLCFDRGGRIYFTDPCYGKKPADGQERFAVYRIDAGKDGEPIINHVTRLIDDVDTPNGICISPDGKTLYVADSAPRLNGPHKLLAYDILADGLCKRRAVVHDFGEGRGIDGMVVDTKGNIYGTAGRGDKTGVYIFTPAGKRINFIATPETATNCTFAGQDLKTLYITAGTSVYRIRLNAVGFLAYP